jgi:ubiquitin-activating enzyme E1
MIQKISNAKEGVVELIQNVKHKLEDGDEVVFQGVEGMKLKAGMKHDDPQVKSDSINDTIHKVKVLTPYSFTIGDTEKFEPYVRNGIAKQLKTKVQFKFKSYADSVRAKVDDMPLDANLAIADWEKMHHNQAVHLCFQALGKFKAENKRLPKVWDLADAKKFVEIATTLAKESKVSEDDLKEDGPLLRLLYLFPLQSQGVFNPLCAFLGGLVAQECIKAITQKFSPVHQLFYYDAVEVLPEFRVKEEVLDLQKAAEAEKDATPEKLFENYVEKVAKTAERGDRADGLRIVLGHDMIEKLAETRLFMVGAGAIGCELLKNYAMLGVGCAKKDEKAGKKGGTIVLTDPDVIEVSNLNRQFLFREKHLRKPKSSTAAAAALQMNKDLKGNIIARLDKVHEGTNHIFTDQFFEGLTIVTNALDNLAARRYVDSRCVAAKTPLLESGTLGPKGHVQVILPHLTESYASQKDPEDNTEIPHCTLKMFPEETLHCVEWARDLFGQLFSQGPKSALKLLEDGDQHEYASAQDLATFKEGFHLLKERPKTFADCIEHARLLFEKYFSHDIQQLLHVYPLDAKTKEGNLFWSLPKRPPSPTAFDKTNDLHLRVVASTACLRATIFKIAIPTEKPRSEEFRKEIGEQAAKVKVPDFVPSDADAQAIQADVEKQGKDGKDEEEAKEEEQEGEKEKKEVEGDELEQMKKEFKEIYAEVGKVEKGKTFEDTVIQAEEFEKDDDSNFHIDFMHAMGNCRAANYKLGEMDWLQVKLKAGRIVPAMATTTAAIAGLQTLELVKLVYDTKKADHRNAFLNLAVPIMQASEPGDVQKVKLTDKIETTLWDRWEVDGANPTLKDLIAKVEAKYEGLEVRDVLRGNTPLYFHAIMNAAGREKEKEQALNSTLADLLEVSLEDVSKGELEPYVDLTITCALKGDPEGKIVEGVPLLRAKLA